MAVLVRLIYRSLATLLSWLALLPEPVKLYGTSGGVNAGCGVLLRLDGGPWLVDPRLGGQFRRLGRTAEAVGAGGVGGVEDLLAAGLDGDRGTVVDGLRGVQADPGVPVPGVVVGEKEVAEFAGLSDAGEFPRERGAVFQGLELRF